MVMILWRSVIWNVSLKHFPLRNVSPVTTYLCLTVFLPVNKGVCLTNRHSLPHFAWSRAPLPASKLSVPAVNNKFIGPGHLQERKLLCMARNKSRAKQWFLLWNMATGAHLWLLVPSPPAYLRKQVVFCTPIRKRCCRKPKSELGFRVNSQH